MGIYSQECTVKSGRKEGADSYPGYRERIKGMLDTIAGYREKYVKGSGPSETKGGEIIRALDHIVYEYFTDGLRIGDTDDLDSSYEFLLGATADPERNRSRFGGFTLRYTIVDFLRCESEDDYLGMLADVVADVTDWISERKDDVFRIPNRFNSRTRPGGR